MFPYSFTNILLYAHENLKVDPIISLFLRKKSLINPDYVLFFLCFNDNNKIQNLLKFVMIFTLYANRGCPTYLPHYRLNQFFPCNLEV